MGKVPAALPGGGFLWVSPLQTGSDTCGSCAHTVDNEGTKSSPLATHQATQPGRTLRPLEKGLPSLTSTDAPAPAPRPDRFGIKTLSWLFLTSTVLLGSIRSPPLT